MKSEDQSRQRGWTAQRTSGETLGAFKVLGRNYSCFVRGWDYHIHTTIYKIGNQQEPTEGNVIQYSVITYMRKESEKNRDMYM